MDVTSAEQIDDVMGATLQEFGSLEILVNNAGVNTLKQPVPIDQFPVEEWNRVLVVDLTGPYLVSKAAGQVMRK